MVAVSRPGLHRHGISKSGWSIRTARNANIVVSPSKVLRAVARRVSGRSEGAPCLTLCLSLDGHCFYERRKLALERLDRTAAPTLRHGL